MEETKDKHHFDLGELFGIAWRRKWLLVFPTILGAIAAFAIGFVLTPVYETSTIVWVGSSMRISGDLQRLIGGDITALGRSRNRGEELRSLYNEITSSPFLQQLVDRMNLAKDPVIDRKAHNLASEWPHLTVEQIKANLLIEDLREKIRVEFSGSDQVRITTESRNPQKARDLAQNISEIFISEKKRQQMGEVMASQDFSYGQLEKYEKDLNDIVARKTEFEKEYMKVQIDDIVTSDENRRDIGSEIQSAKIEITDKEDEARLLLRKITAVPAAKIELNESEELRRLKQEVQTLLASVANLMLRYRWTAPEILNFKARLYSYMDQIEDENRRLVEIQFVSEDQVTRANLTQLFNTRAYLDMLYARQNNLELALANLNNKIGLMPEYQARLDQYNREIEAARDLRDRFREQQETAQISQAVVNETEYKIIQPAQIPLEPIFPQKTKLILMGLMSGMVLGGGLVLIRELMDTTFKRVEEVEEYLNLPVVGVIPNIETVKKARF